MQVHFGSLSQWHLHFGVGTSPREIPVRLSVMMESRSEMVLMGRVGLFTLYISDPPGQDFRRGGANLGGNPGCPGEQGKILAGQSFSERFALPVVESGWKW